MALRIRLLIRQAFQPESNPWICKGGRRALANSRKLSSDLHMCTVCAVTLTNQNKTLSQSAWATDVAHLVDNHYMMSEYKLYFMCTHVYMCTILMNQIQDFAYSRQKCCMEPVPEKLNFAFCWFGFLLLLVGGGGGDGSVSCLWDWVLSYHVVIELGLSGSAADTLCTISPVL